MQEKSRSTKHYIQLSNGVGLQGHLQGLPYHEKKRGLPAHGEP